jgi:hypothetical protein
VRSEPFLHCISAAFHFGNRICHWTPAALDACGFRSRPRWGAGVPAGLGSAASAFLAAKLKQAGLEENCHPERPLIRGEGPATTSHTTTRRPFVAIGQFLNCGSFSTIRSPPLRSSPAAAKYLFFQRLFLTCTEIRHCAADSCSVHSALVSLGASGPRPTANDQRRFVEMSRPSNSRTPVNHADASI